MTADEPRDNPGSPEPEPAWEQPFVGGPAGPPVSVENRRKQPADQNLFFFRPANPAPEAETTEGERRPGRRRFVAAAIAAAACGALMAAIMLVHGAIRPTDQDGAPVPESERNGGAVVSPQAFSSLIAPRFGEPGSGSPASAHPAGSSPASPSPSETTSPAASASASAAPGGTTTTGAAGHGSATGSGGSSSGSGGHKTGGAPSPAGSPAATSPAAQPPDNNSPSSDENSLQSVNYPDRYITARDGLGFLDQVNGGSSAYTRQQATFILVPGLADAHCVSFATSSGAYLRHQNFRLKLAYFDGSSLFRQDATFCERPGVVAGSVSFQSYNYPGRYLRHRNFQLWLDPNDGSYLYRNDSSFRITAALG